MAVPQTQVWADYMLQEISAKPGLFQNGIIQIDARPVFAQKDVRYRVPFLKDLKSIAGGSTDQKITNVTNMKLTTKRADGYTEQAPILFRGDAIEDNWFEMARTGDEVFARYAPQLADYIALCMEDTYFSLLKGLFGVPGTAGCLSTTHQHIGGAIGNTYTAGILTNLTQDDIASAKAAHSNADGGADGAGDELVVAFVNPLVKADVVSRTSLVSSLSDGTAANAYVNGKVDKLGGAILIEAPRMCAGYDNGSGVTVYPTYLMGLNSMYLGFERSLQTFIDQVPLVNGRQYLLSWMHAYAPHVYGVNYATGGPDNPDRSDLETVTNYTRTGKVSDIDIRRIVSKIG